MANRINLNWAADMIGVMQGAGSDFNSPDIMLGEVVTPPPALTIKVGNITLYKEQLLVADYLLKDYKRAYLAEGIVHIKAEADEALKGLTKMRETPEAEVPNASVNNAAVPSATIATHGSHAHGAHGHGTHGHGKHKHPEHDHEFKEIEINSTKDNFTAHGDGEDPVVSGETVNDGKADKKFFWFKDTLRPKDLVLVQQLPNSHYFAVTNRLMRMADIESNKEDA